MKTTNKFEKDFIKCIKRNFDPDALGEIPELLEKTGKLPGFTRYTHFQENIKVFANTILNPIGY